MDSDFDKIQPSLYDDIGELDDYYTRYMYDDHHHTTTTHHNDHLSQKAVAEWGGEEVSEWARQAASQSNLDPYSSDLWRLGSISGQQLLSLTPTALSALVGEAYATALLPRLRLLQQSQGSQSTMAQSYRLDSYDTHMHPYTWEVEEAPLATGGGAGFAEAFAGSDGVSARGFEGKVEDNFEDLALTVEGMLGSPFDEFKGAFAGGSSPGVHDLNDELQGLNLEEFRLITYDPLAQAEEEEEEEEEEGARGGWRKRMEEGDVDEEELLNYIRGSNLLERIPSETRRRARGPKSWEFLMRLLADPMTNPAVVRWEDESQGTFRLIRPSLIAHVWSSRPGLPRKTSYNNFARGLRHHYTTEALHPVMEKQLVYRCGDQALQYYHRIKQQRA